MPLTTSESPDHSSKNSSQISVISEQEFSSVTSVTNGSQDETSEMRPTRLNLNLAPTKTRSHSSSPLSHEKSRKSKHRHYPASGLQKTTSLKSLEELELEEVKGFKDLGFNFEGERLSKRLVRLIPGLQRIDGGGGAAAVDEEDSDDDEIEEESSGVVMRPYLSEAWLLKSSGGYDCAPPLASRVCTAVDMKRRLSTHGQRSWVQAPRSADSGTINTEGYKRQCGRLKLGGNLRLDRWGQHEVGGTNMKQPLRWDPAAGYVGPTWSWEASQPKPRELTTAVRSTSLTGRPQHQHTEEESQPRQNTTSRHGADRNRSSASHPPVRRLFNLPREEARFAEVEARFGENVR
ncbi:Unknown protein [Striga hermonthica]|uniref:Uncharacterized protein n=1 Tax=Striga hermonthica TaxID=68872 RepID=A0A9N7N9T8_STRHE|nr:Unknown protein [Striga hermonthica]